MNRNRQNSISACIFFGAMITIFARQPILFIEPRFWAEEGSRFFSFAFSNPWFVSLVHPVGGYLNFYPNVAATIAANFVPLTAAPFVTLIAALFVLLTPIAIILFSRSPMWASEKILSRQIKIAIAVAIVIVAPFSDELWLNTINCQFYFSLIATLLLLEDSDYGRVKRWSYRILLGLCGVSGAISTVLTPLFFCKWFLNKNKENLIQLSIITICLIIQIIIAIKFPYNNVAHQNSRFVPMDYSLFATISYTNTMSPIFFGFDNTAILANITYTLRQSIMNFRAVGNILLLFQIILFASLLSTTKNRKYLLYLLGAFILLEITGSGLAAGDKFAQLYPTSNARYHFAPTVILMLSILISIDFKREVFAFARSTLLLIMLIASLWHGFMEYKSGHSFLASTDEYSKNNWVKEVAKWEKDNNYGIQIWPSGWGMQLAKQPKDGKK